MDKKGAAILSKRVAHGRNSPCTQRGEPETMCICICVCIGVCVCVFIRGRGSRDWCDRMRHDHKTLSTFIIAGSTV